jgi:hypothetical protein
VSWCSLVHWSFSWFNRYLFDCDGYQIANPPKGLEKLDKRLAVLAYDTARRAKQHLLDEEDPGTYNAYSSELSILSRKISWLTSWRFPLRSEFTLHCFMPVYWPYPSLLPFKQNVSHVPPLFNRHRWRDQFTRFFVCLQELNMTGNNWLDRIILVIPIYRSFRHTSTTFILRDHCRFEMSWTEKSPKAHVSDWSFLPDAMSGREKSSVFLTKVYLYVQLFRTLSHILIVQEEEEVVEDHSKKSGKRRNIKKPKTTAAAHVNKKDRCYW